LYQDRFLVLNDYFQKVHKSGEFLDLDQEGTSQRVVKM